MVGAVYSIIELSLGLGLALPEPLVLADALLAHRALPVGELLVLADLCGVAVLAAHLGGCHMFMWQGVAGSGSGRAAE